MYAGRQYQQEAPDRTEIAVAAATAQTQSDMLHELFRIEQAVGKTVFESANGEAQSDAVGGRKCDARAKKYVDV